MKLRWSRCAEMLDFRDRKTVESSDESDDDDDEGEVVTSPTAIRTKHDLMMKTEVCTGLLLSCSGWLCSHCVFYAELAVQLTLPEQSKEFVVSMNGITEMFWIDVDSIWGRALHHLQGTGS